MKYQILKSVNDVTFFKIYVTSFRFMLLNLDVSKFINKSLNKDDIRKICNWN